MYIPPHFKEDRVDILHAAIRRAGAATLVSMTAEGLFASHAPLLLDPEPAPYGTLVGHLAKANPHRRLLDGQPAGVVETRAVETGAVETGAVETLVIFQGPGGYITPSYYAAKKEHGKVVPTWNYAAIHAYGVLETFDDPDRLLSVVTRLTDAHEASRAAPWAVSDAPADFVQGMLKGIYGISLRITRLEGKVKMSQNRPAADRPGIVEGLRADGRAELAEAVTEALSRVPSDAPRS
ncbi:MAG TPA: FMN-binding negative transcriptional regulator [Rhodopila sp.]|uniref:FMN-binding negative transcriptional regulator n=1 Tax=Rhodopila sp. TaxID=2480087 RepID=UPI002BA861A5|nr:FMN-binding negative transcriptional regulator [Rhodopila sp.]HVY17693.1 FMN-binding negative transcriptional regulator [Rhodopila sp.]